MLFFKCKMCGGMIEFNPGDTVGVCNSCGTKQTLPRVNDFRRLNLYDQANDYRRNNEFDKAAAIYEQLLSEDNTDAEAYWSLILCRHGIGYTEDPVTHKYVPTVNRAQRALIIDDIYYKSALQYADVNQGAIYKAEANAICEIQKGLLAAGQTAAKDPANVALLLDRAFMLLKEGEWNKAEAMCDQALKQDPRNTQAYLGKLMAKLRIHRQEDISGYVQPDNNNNSFKNVSQAGSDKLVNSPLDQKNAEEQKSTMPQNTEEIKAKDIKKFLAEKKHIAAVCAVLIIVLALFIIFKLKPGMTVDRKEAGYSDLISAQLESISEAEVGSSVIYGSYEQDNNDDNGKEAIEWLVLAREGDRVLLLSRYGLDNQKFNSSGEGVTWEDCSLREWLNGTFINEAFSSEAQNSILSSTVSEDDNSGNSTTDKVFLLSIKEAEEYLESDTDRQCQGTTYWKNQAGNSAYGDARRNCWWWLRSPGKSSSYASYVYNDGHILKNGLESSSRAVRPAMWINIK